MLHICSENSLSSLSSFRLGDVQPNACDVRLDRVFKPTIEDLRFNRHPTVFRIDENEKIHRKTEEVFPNDDGYFDLAPGYYEVAMEGTVAIGDGEAGFIITRSTLNRNGVFLTSGLYDAGYSGRMMGVLHNYGGQTQIKKGTRVGQFLLYKAETLHLYDGSYGIDSDGKLKEEEIKLYGAPDPQ